MQFVICCRLGNPPTEMKASNDEDHVILARPKKTVVHTSQVPEVSNYNVDTPKVQLQYDDGSSDLSDVGCDYKYTMPFTANKKLYTEKGKAKENIVRGTKFGQIHMLHTSLYFPTIMLLIIISDINTLDKDDAIDLQMPKFQGGKVNDMEGNSSEPDFYITQKDPKVVNSASECLFSDTSGVSEVGAVSNRYNISEQKTSLKKKGVVGKRKFVTFQGNI